ncbi:hypothetical protein HOE67_01595 [Candidatus Peregrinibacteria bacterium]|nr:hypothetical protein [Candidatus Peregrinibacteria bacterium]MBT4055781.1 hypothetical protein [Candidatus Peregrinibacteria bacterium]
MWKKLLASMAAIGVLSANVALAADATLVTSATTDVATFNPTAGETITLTVEVSTFANVQADVLTSTGIVLDSLASATATTSFPYVVEYDGMDGGVALTDGDYIFTVHATESANPTHVMDVAVPFTVDSVVVDPGLSVTDLTVSDATYYPMEGDVLFSYVLSEDANSTLCVEDVTTSEVVYCSADVLGSSNTVTWDGKDLAGDYVAAGDYTATVNAYIASTDTASLAVDLDIAYRPIASDCDDASLSGDIVKELCVDPSPWDPSDDDELEIEWEFDVDVEEMLLTAYEVNGNNEVELWDDEEMDDDDYEYNWDGLDDDDEFIEEGLWAISLWVADENGNEEEIVYYVEVEYQLPEIESGDMFVTKDEIDNTLGEFTYVVFKTNQDAVVTVAVVDESNDEVVELWEEEDVEEDKWYAIEWDGMDDDSDEVDDDENYKFEVSVMNVLNDDVEDVYYSENILVEEDEVSSTRANVTNDYIFPVVMPKSTEEDSVVTYTIDEDAEVTVEIFKGSKSSNPEVVLVEDATKEAGTYTVDWDGRDEDGKTLDKDEKYSYRVTAKAIGSTRTDKERGYFVVGNAGNEGETPVGPITTDGSCSDYFYDVSENSADCEAIAWAYERGIVQGDNKITFLGKRSFRPNETIDRVEAVTVALKAFDAPILPADGTNLGWTDVTVGQWYMPYLRTGKWLGMVEGYDSSTLVKPHRDVTRTQMLRLALEAASAVNGYKVPTCSANHYKDTKYSWYTDYVCVSYEYDLFDTFAGNFMPGEDATRSEVVGMLYRMYEAGLIQ